MYPKVVTTYTRLQRSDSLPMFNYNNNRAQILPYSLRYNSSNHDKAFLTGENLKMQMMEERLKNLEKQKQDQNDQINALMSYQMQQNRLNKSNSTHALPINEPNPLLLAGNNILNNGRTKTYNDFFKKQKKLHRSYKKDIDEIKDYLGSEKMDRRINRNLRNNIYLPIKNDINNFMEEINYNLQKKMENDNNIVNSNLNEVQNNYEEIKYLLQDKIDKMEHKQKMDFETLKNQLENNAEKEKIMNMRMAEMGDKDQLFQNEINNHISEEIRKQRELDEMKHQKELDELRRKHEIEDLENKKIVDELRFQRMREGVMKTKYRIQNNQSQPPVVQPMIQQMPMPIIYPFPNNQGNNNNNNNNPHTSDELFKLFMMKSIFGQDLFPSQKKKKVKYKY